MTNQLSIELNSAFYVRSKISYYPLAHSIYPNPNGLSVVIFKTMEDLKEYYKLRGIDAAEEVNFDILKVKSLYDLMREVADLGYAGIWYYNNFPIFFGNYLSDIDIEIPSFAYTYQGQYLGASGMIEEPKEFYPWVNCSKTDKIIRRFIKFQKGVPFDFTEDIYTLVRKSDSGKITYCQFPDSSPLQGSYVSDIGALCLFTEEKYALDFLQTRGKLSEYLVIHKVKIDQFFKEISGMFPFMDIGINPGNARYLQGYFLRDVEHKKIKTVHGTYELDKSFVLNEIDNPDEYSNNDTIDKPNTVDPSLRGFLSTIKNPLKYVLGPTQSVLTKKEARTLIDRLIKNSENKFADEEQVSVNSISSDSFLVFGFDKVTGDHLSNNEEGISPYVFKDIFAAILWFYHRHFSFEYDLRLNGFYHCVSDRKVKGTNDTEREDFILSENQQALSELMEMILTEGYKIEHSELLMSYINRSSISLEVEACGYLGDFAFFKEAFIEQKFRDEDAYEEEEEEDRSEISERIRSLLQSYKDKLKSKIDLSDQYQNKIKIYLGSAYNNLSLESRVILESALRQFEGSKKIINHDYAGISMKLCKTFERELKNQFFETWKREVKKDINKDNLKKHLQAAKEIGDRNLEELIMFALGQGKSNPGLGLMQHIISNIIKSHDQEVYDHLYKYISTFQNSSYILSEEVQEHCEKIASTYRNGGVHEKILTYETCQEAFKKILMDKQSYLARLLSF